MASGFLTIKNRRDLRVPNKSDQDFSKKVEFVYILTPQQNIFSFTASLTGRSIRLMPTSTRRKILTFRSRDRPPNPAFFSPKSREEKLYDGRASWFLWFFDLFQWAQISLILHGYFRVKAVGHILLEFSVIYWYVIGPLLWLWVFMNISK